MAPGVAVFARFAGGESALQSIALAAAAFFLSESRLRRASFHSSTSAAGMLWILQQGRGGVKRWAGGVRCETYIPERSASLAASFDIPPSRVFLPSWIIRIVVAAFSAA